MTMSVYGRDTHEWFGWRIASGSRKCGQELSTFSVETSTVSVLDDKTYEEQQPIHVLSD